VSALSLYWRQVRGLRREVWTILAAGAALGFTWYGVSDTLLNLYLVRLGFGPRFVGLSAAVAILFYGLASIPAAILSRRLGFRRGMIAGILVWVGGSLALASSYLWPERVLPFWVVGTRLLASSGLALYWVSSAPYLAEVTAPGERPHAFSLMMSVNPLGTFLGSLVGGLLPGWIAGAQGGLAPGPYGAALALGMTVYLPVLWALARVDGGRPETSAQRAARGVGRIPYGALLMIGGVCFLRVGGEYAARTFFNVYADSVWLAPTASIGLAISIASLMTIPAPLLTPPLVRRWGRLPTVAWGALGVSASMLLLALGGSFPAASGAYVAMNVAAAMARSVWTLVIQESVGAEWRSVASGVANLFSGLGVSAMAGVGGVLAASLGYSSTFMTGAVLVGLGSGVLWLVHWRHTGRPRDAPGESG